MRAAQTIRTSAYKATCPNILNRLVHAIESLHKGTPAHLGRPDRWISFPGDVHAAPNGSANRRLPIRNLAPGRPRV